MKFNGVIKFTLFFVVGLALGACGRTFKAPSLDQSRLGQVNYYAKRFDSLFEGAQKADDHRILRRELSAFSAQRQSSQVADGEFVMATIAENCQDRAGAKIPYNAKDLAETAKIGEGYLFGEDSAAGMGFNVICVPQKIEGEHVCNQYIVAISKVYSSNRVGSALVLLEEILDTENIGKKKLVVRDMPGLSRHFIRPTTVENLLSQNCNPALTQPTLSTGAPTPQPTGQQQEIGEDSGFIDWLEGLFGEGDSESDEALNPFVIPDGDEYIFGEDELVEVDDDDPWWYL